MTLKEWSKKSGILPTHPTTEKKAVSVVLRIDNPHYQDLWKLSDYKVSSVLAGVVWLVPVIGNTPCE